MERTEFNKRAIRFTCSCGTERAHVHVGVNSWGEMVFEWTCLKCKKKVMARIPIEKLIADMPPHTDQKLLTTQSDEDFLHDMGVDGDFKAKPGEVE